MAKIPDLSASSVPSQRDVCDGSGPGENFRKIAEGWPKSDVERGALVSAMRERVVGGTLRGRSIFIGVGESE